MADMNMKLDDEMLEEVTGGTGEQSDEPKFDIGDHVSKSFGKRTGYVLKVYKRFEGSHFWVYDVHWEATDTEPEEVEKEVSEGRLQAAD